MYLSKQLQPFTPLYNYLKPFPDFLQKQFYEKYGGKEEFSFRTASPVLGSLNSGMQLYQIKHLHPRVFSLIKIALHLPQYLSYLITSRLFSDITSVGCHTILWDFSRNNYHRWVQDEGLFEKLAPLESCDEVFPVSLSGNNYSVGIGLHDSSAALIPYLINFHEPFVLISTGTWCISLNPFNHSPLTKAELQNDCLCYMSYEGKPVKASILFAGYEHEKQVERIFKHFDQSQEKYLTIDFNPRIIQGLKNKNEEQNKFLENSLNPKEFLFAKRELSAFENDNEAYHQLIFDIIKQQKKSTQLVVEATGVKRIFVYGGFSNNSIYMNLLAAAFPEIEVFAASMPQATALGAALCMHDSWNKNELPNDIIQLKYFSSGILA